MGLAWVIALEDAAGPDLLQVEMKWVRVAPMTAKYNFATLEHAAHGPWECHTLDEPDCAFQVGTLVVAEQLQRRTPDTFQHVEHTEIPQSTDRPTDPPTHRPTDRPTDRPKHRKVNADYEVVSFKLYSHLSVRVCCALWATALASTAASGMFWHLAFHAIDDLDLVP